MTDSGVKQNKMGTDPMFPLIIRMALPAMFSMLVQSLYNVIDSFFVAKYSSAALSAVSLAFPIQNLIIALGLGVSVGTGSLISRKLGEGNTKDADSAASHSLLLGILVWLFFVVFGFFFSNPFYRMFESDPEIIKMGVDYTMIVTIGSLGIMMQLCFEKVIQATGNMLWPMMIQLVGAVTNIILDPIFIFGYCGFPVMGVKGAAIATILGQFMGAAVGALVMIFIDHEVAIKFKGFKLDKNIIKDILAVGLPTAVMNSIGTIMTMAMNAILAGFSVAAYTVFGIFFKLQSLVFMPIFGMNSGIMPILGYNYGARNKKRMYSALKIGIIMAVSMNAVGTLIFELFPKQLLSLFNATDEILEIGVPALRIIATTFMVAAVCIILSTLFQAVGKGSYSMICSILRQLAVLVPCAYVLSKFGLTATWFSLPLSDISALIVTMVLYWMLKKKKLNQL